MIEMSVSRLGLDSTTNSYVVVLRERGGRRLLPIWIGQPEAESIALQLNRIHRERPMTHDLCKALIVGLGGTVRHVRITGVERNVYFAELQVEGTQGTVAVDARPSDGIALALRFDAPIFAPEGLLTAMDAVEAPGALPTPPGMVPREQELTADELQRYLGSLRPEDFGRFQP